VGPGETLGSSWIPLAIRAWIECACNAPEGCNHRGRGDAIKPMDLYSPTTNVSGQPLYDAGMQGGVANLMGKQGMINPIDGLTDVYGHRRSPGWWLVLAETNSCASGKGKKGGGVERKPCWVGASGREEVMKEFSPWRKEGDGTIKGAKVRGLSGFED
jgi:hypothetical protein